jgi:ABC-type multidrug transport system fused ATPase/permease subunit
MKTYSCASAAHRVTWPSPLSLIADLWGILTGAQKRRVLAAQLISVAMAFSTVTGIAAIAPFFAVLGDSTLIDRNKVLHWAYIHGGFSDQRSFVVALGIAFVAVMLLANLINILGSLAANRLALRIGDELQRTLFEEYLSRPYAFHVGTNSATLVNNVIYETTRVASGVLQNALLFVTSLITATLIVASVLIINPSISITMFLVLAGGYLLIYLSVRRQLLRVGVAHSRAWSDRARIVSESFGAIREVLLLRDHRLFEAIFERSSTDVSETNARTHRIGQIPKHLMECIAVAALVGAALVPSTHAGGMGAWLGQLTFIAFAAYRLLPTLQQIFLCTVRIRADGAGLTLIAPDLRQARSRRKTLGGNDALPENPWQEGPREYIRVKDVSFNYAAGRTRTLEGIDMLIPARSSIAIVGANGSGKTTLVDLVAGLLAPTTGEVQVDGVVLSDANRKAWQAQIAYVPQNVFLLDASIAQNIAFGTPLEAIDKPRLIEAARLAQLADFIATLPEGYNHEVGERGVRLSGGQRQRVGIARALYKGTPVLLLDEAMSALDGITEAELMTALEGLRGRCTIILIAHRLSMVRWCDAIYQLEGGRITDSGSYDELTQKSEPFRRMFGAV